MKRLPILIVALICAAAPGLAQDSEAPAPEYKSWDRERLEVAYQARCDELAQAKKDLEEANAKIKTMEEAAADQQKAKDAKPRTGYYRDPRMVIDTFPPEAIPKYVGDKKTIPEIERILKTRVVGWRIDILAAKPEPVRFERGGITFVVFTKREGTGNTIKSAVIRYANSAYEIGLVVE